MTDITTLKESQHVEFKKSFNKEAAISLSAFANTEGGKVVIGVDDKGIVTGVDVRPETEQRFLNEIKLSTYPQIMPFVTVIEVEGKKIVILKISEYPVKPVSCKGRYYKRMKNSNHVMSLDEIVNMQLQSLNVSYDAYPVNEPFQSLDESLLNLFIEKINSKGRVNLNDDLLTNLTKLKLIQKSNPTLAAMLLFGNHGYSIHIGRFKSEDTIIDDMYIREPLLTALDEVMIFIKKHINLSFHFDGNLERKELWQYPLDVIRELLLNAVVHRDYKHSSDIVIKIFDDRLIFTNPGTLYGSQNLRDLEEDDYVSSIRNKLLAEAFYLMGDIERYGTGFVRIRKILKHHPRLSFDMEETGDFFKARLRYHTEENVKPDERIKKQAQSPARINHEGLNEGLQRLISYLAENPGKRIPEISKSLDVHGKTLERWIRAAYKKTLIEFRGSKKTGGYFLVNGVDDKDTNDL